MDLIIGHLLEVKVKQGHGRRITIASFNCPLVWHEIVLMEQLGSFCCLWYQSLSLTDVIDDDSTHVVVKLLSCKLELVVCA
jgi:hypothetical protein